MLLVSIKEGRRERKGGKKGRRSPSSFLLPSKTKFREGGSEGERERECFTAYWLEFGAFLKKKEGTEGRKWKRNSEEDSKGKSSVVDGWIDVSAEKDGKRKKNSQ